MNIVILSRNPGLYSTQSLARAARMRHHFVRIIDYVNCDLIISDGSLSIAYHGQTIEDIDAIIPRIGASWTSYGAAVIRQFEYLDVFTTLSSEALVNARNKLICSQILSSQGMHLPKSIVSNNSYAYGNLLNQFDGEKVVIKLVNSTHGVGVLLANKGGQAENILEAFTRSRQKSMIQEYIKEAGGSDIRVFIVDDAVVASMKRQAQPGEFRSNLHRGGSSSIEEISDDEARIALSAAKILGLKVAGVDMLRSDRGALLLEVNASPGLEGIEKTTKMDIAGRIINFVEKSVKK
jgi:ribosomal protein S6--L-glutamate ligase